MKADLDAFIERIQKLLDETVNKNINYGRHMVGYRDDYFAPNNTFQAIDSYLSKDGSKPRSGISPVFGSGCSVFCFVVLKDSDSNKSLGKVTKGDVMKPASYKAPAKHARGNIYDAHQGMKDMKWTGPAYLNEVS